MLEQDRQTLAESECPEACRPYTVELLTGSAGMLVTLVILYLMFFDGMVVF